VQTDDVRVFESGKNLSFFFESVEKFVRKKNSIDGDALLECAVKTFAFKHHALICMPL
jgi:hypothetical protein